MLNAAYSLVLSKHSTENDVINAKLMSIEELLIYGICEVAYKSLNDPGCPKYCN